GARVALGDVALAQISGQSLGVALGRWPVTSAPAGAQLDQGPLRQRNTGRLPHPGFGAVGVGHGDAVRARDGAALQPPRGCRGAFAGRREVAVLEHPEGVVDAETTTVATRASGISRQLEALEPPRVALLPHLRGREAAAGFGGVDNAA